MLSPDERAYGVGPASSGPAPRKHGANSVVKKSPPPEISHVWEGRKGSWSAFNGDCVEVADLGGGLIGVRDSKETAERAVLVLSSSAFQACIDNIKSFSITS